MVVFKMRDSVCNVLCQWRIWLILTYRVYPLYDVFYIIMLARQSGERCSQPSHNSFWTFSHTPLTVNPTWLFFIDLAKYYNYVNFFNTFKLKMATNFTMSIVYSSCHKNILCFCSGTAHDRYLHVMKRNIISL